MPPAPPPPHRRPWHSPGPKEQCWPPTLVRRNFGPLNLGTHCQITSGSTWPSIPFVAPRASSHRVTPKWPFSHAAHSSASPKFPLQIKELLRAKCPLAHATSMGVKPRVLQRRTSPEPALTSHAATSRCPPAHASHGAVQPALAVHQLVKDAHSRFPDDAHASSNATPELWRSSSARRR